MAEQPSSALTMLTEFFSAEHIEAAARQTGFVQRTSKITGPIFLALVTFGVWGDAKTTLAQLAAKVAQLSQHVAVSPEAIYQRMNKRALAFLQELIRQAFAKLDQRGHLNRNLRFEYIRQSESRKINGLCSP